MTTKTDDRARFIAALDNALIDLARELPQLEGALALRWGFQYFAELHARQLGHAATYQMLVETARRGVQQAAEELTAERH